MAISRDTAGITADHREATALTVQQKPMTARRARRLVAGTTARRGARLTGFVHNRLQLHGRAGTDQIPVAIRVVNACHRRPELAVMQPG